MTGKWDPGAYDMDKHRATVAALMSGEDDMATADEIWAETIKQAGDRHASVVLGQVWREVFALKAALAALAGGINPTVKAAVEAALADATVQVDVNVNGASK